jgi:hypothetical protein
VLQRPNGEKNINVPTEPFMDTALNKRVAARTQNVEGVTVAYSRGNATTPTGNMKDVQDDKKGAL